MKITRIDFINHPVFTNHSVYFNDGISVPTINFLVGDNGSGKTVILETIYDYLITFSPNKMFHPSEVVFHLLLSADEQVSLGTTLNAIIYNVKKNIHGGLEGTLTDTSGNNLHSPIGIATIIKSVYSTIETTFESAPVKAVTGKNIDDTATPKERSENLAVLIPQLLVDISSIDDAEISNWHKANKGTTQLIPENIGTRLDRFINAFHKIYGGTKIFSEIKNIAEEKQVTFIDSIGQEVALKNLSTGEKQIIYRIGYILKNLSNINGGIILIDEPEISLHPAWQVKLKDFLLEIFSSYDVQIIIATHSPYIFQRLNDANEVCIKIDRNQPQSRKIQINFPNLPNFKPSVNLISFLAYGIVSEALHIELYTLLQIRENRDFIRNSPGNQDGIENWLQDDAGGNIPIAQTFTKTGKNHPTSETLMTWIRNKIHHSSEQARPNFTEQDLKTSVIQMIQLLQS